MNRSKQPDFNIPQSIKYILPQIHPMPNGTKIYLVQGGTQEVMRFSIIFSAGTRYQDAPFVASTAVRMLNEGTAKFTAAQIAEKLDFYGASYEVNIDNDWAMLSVYCLTKHCSNVLSIVHDFVTKPSYPNHELDVYKRKNKQRLILQREKVETLARESFLAALYGAKHPYGFSAQANDYDALQSDWLHKFHRQYLTSANTFMVLAGNFGQEEIDTVEKYFDSSSWGEAVSEPSFPPLSPGVEKKISLTKDDAIQSAIRIGRVLFDRHHPDYSGMMLLTCILGGYFGSRLMQNIRENKGYTYGIFAMLVTRQHSAYLTITTETGVEYTEAVLTEIYNEIERLQTELIPETELNLVKQYLFGEMLRSLDGPWAQTEVAIEMIQLKQENNYIEKLFEEVKHLQANKLMELAAKYLNREDLYQVVVKNEQ